MLHPLFLVQVGEPKRAQNPNEVEHTEQNGQHEPPIRDVICHSHVLFECDRLQWRPIFALRLIHVAHEATEHVGVVGHLELVSVFASLRRLKKIARVSLVEEGFRLVRLLLEHFLCEVRARTRLRGEVIQLRNYARFYLIQRYLKSEKFLVALVIIWEIIEFQKVKWYF